MKSHLLGQQFSTILLQFAASVVVFLFAPDLQAQREPHFNNTIRYNVTNPIIFGSKSIIFGYERQLKNNQSFSVNIGSATFPRLSSVNIDTPELSLASGSKEKGINLSADYRFYLAKLNRFKAPRGVYIGPFVSYNFFDRINNWMLNSTDFQGEVKTDLSFNIQTAGVELGYQFVFWKRLTLDMILIGPGIASYKFQARFNTSLGQEDKDKFLDALNNYLSEKFPGYNQVIDANTFKKTGTTSITTAGFRYMIMVGFRF